MIGEHESRQTGASASAASAAPAAPPAAASSASWIRVCLGFPAAPLQWPPLQAQTAWQHPLCASPSAALQSAAPVALSCDSQGRSQPQWWLHAGQGCICLGGAGHLHQLTMASCTREDTVIHAPMFKVQSVLPTIVSICPLLSPLPSLCL